MTIDRPASVASLWQNIRLAMLAFVACVAGLVGYVAFGMTYIYLTGKLYRPFVDTSGMYLDAYLGSQFDFILVSLYCFAAGIGAIYYFGRLAPLLAGLLLVVAGTMVAWAANPGINGWYIGAFGAFGGAVTASIVLPCIYLHMHGVLGHADRRQFSLRGLLLAVVVVSVLFGGLTMRRQYAEYRQQRIREMLGQTSSPLYDGPPRPSINRRSHPFNGLGGPLYDRSMNHSPREASAYKIEFLSNASTK